MKARVAAVIPARMASTRYPGKPLLEVAGLPMVEHVRRRALLCGAFVEVAVATCDEEIARVIRGYGGRVILTSPEHPGGTDRVAEAARSINCTHVVNVQGDEILALPADLRRMVSSIEKGPETPAWNAVARVETASEMGFDPARILLGVLGYERGFLDRYGGLARTPLEKAESIDQSRVIEHDVELRAVPFSKGYPGINEKRDLPAVEESLRSDPAQQAVLRQVTSLAERPR
jgi:3-deoxy-manno-octulosonate cytidylyltransferase (CMP-KDO synthetase)